jgi:hypothetical protein
MKLTDEQKALNKWWRGKLRRGDALCDQNMCSYCAKERFGFLEGFRAAKLKRGGLRVRKP